jgi:hypothetical protein
MVEVGDISSVLIVGAVERQGSPVQTHDPEQESENRRAEVISPPGAFQSNCKQVTDCGMRRHNRPFCRPSMQEIIVAATK